MQRPLGSQDELMSRGFREPAHRPRPQALQALPPGRWGSGAASASGPPRLSASGRFRGRRQVPRPAPRRGSFPVCVLRGGRGPAPRWWPREALRLPRPSPGSQTQAFASLSPSPTSLCLGLKRRAGHPGWHRPAHTQAPRVRTCPDTEDSWRGPGAGAWEPRRGPQPTRLLLRTWGDQNKGPLSPKRASALEHA